MSGKQSHQAPSAHLNQGDEALVLRQDKGGVSYLMLNRPKAYNALSLACMQALIQQLSLLADDKSIKVIVISGSGKGFCAGHDLREMKEGGHRGFLSGNLFHLCRPDGEDSIYSAAGDCQGTWYCHGSWLPVSGNL
ncbi:enoyl-CoA hydratase-related protein [Oceanospirillum linum]|uniref:enoyl-CoA hydratase-related protein n=1 Tax=Oceanospirillum linum TaxID=966 RepID=UPI00089F0377|nr:enoyl-CoA hydratase-related protein [Oceanospirillum linum]SEG26457.1 Enoyl-CoA hydratase/isomerase [Oleiphilus messinensis]SMP27725.1 Enoyl-CoA hydratase/isomerase [Oceanospirillum linum]